MNGSDALFDLMPTELPEQTRRCICRYLSMRHAVHTPQDLQNLTFFELWLTFARVACGPIKRAEHCLPEFLQCLAAYIQQLKDAPLEELVKQDLAPIVGDKQLRDQLRYSGIVSITALCCFTEEKLDFLQGIGKRRKTYIKQMLRTKANRQLKIEY